MFCTCTVVVQSNTVQLLYKYCSYICGRFLITMRYLCIKSEVGLRSVGNRMEVSQRRIFNPYLRHQLPRCVLFVAKHITCRNNFTKKLLHFLFPYEKLPTFASEKERKEFHKFRFIKFVLVIGSSFLIEFGFS